MRQVPLRAAKGLLRARIAVLEVVPILSLPLAPHRARLAVLVFSPTHPRKLASHAEEALMREAQDHRHARLVQQVFRIRTLVAAILRHALCVR